MQEKGTTLVEMVTVICIIGTLSAIAVLRFNEYSRRLETQNQTRMIYREMLTARRTAMNQGRSRVVKLKSTSFEVYSSTVDDTQGASPQQKITLAHPITVNNGTDGDVTFDPRGLSDTQFSVCTAEVNGDGAVNSVVVGTTRISIGTRKAGSECKSENITKQ